MVKHVFLISGKRKCGKDFCCSILYEILKNSYNVKIVGVSYSLKHQYAKQFGLSYEQLLTEGSYKEQYRENMIVWGEELREKDPSVFCREAVRMAGECDILIVSDCRRISDLDYFQSQFPNDHTTIRISASIPIREKRGYKFKAGVDDALSECGLDDYDFKYYFENESTEEYARTFFSSVEAVELK
ncbi:unnamed protein product [Auanema sp. JU1783]|nr:unnamed protein product [Auanema sp. JU1783]